MLAIFLSFLLLYKYVALFIIMFLAALILPLPATMILIATGAFAAQGYFNIYLILAVSFLACSAGDSTGYFLARFWGKPALVKIGFRKMLKNENFLRLEKRMTKHSFSLVFLTRWLITAIGSPINLLAGLAKIPYGRWFLADLTGEVIYVLFYAGLGFVLSSQWEYLSGVFETFAWSLSLLGIIILVTLFYLRRKK